MYNKSRIIKKLDSKRTAAELFQYFADEKDTVFLDSSLVNKLGRYSIIGYKPYLKLIKDDSGFYVNGYKTIDTTFEDYLKKYLSVHKDKNMSELPMVSGAIGYFSYEYGRKLMEVQSNKEDLVSIPDAVLGFYDFYIIEDRHENTIWLVANGITDKAENLIKSVEQRIEILLENSDDTRVDNKNLFNIEVKPNFEKEEYKKAVDDMIRYIIEGDIYITNMTQQMRVKSDKKPLDVFYDLRENNVRSGVKKMNIKLDEGFLFGLGIFETIAVEDGRPLLLARHLDRMNKSADYFKFGSCTERGITEDRIQRYLSEQEAPIKKHGVLKIVMSAENSFFQVRQNPYSEDDYTKGFMTDISKVRRNETSPFVYRKTLNYGDCIIEKRAAAAAGINEMVFTNTKGQISEGTVSNIFFVRKNTIYTPKLSCGLLPGIVREYVMERFNVEETIIYPDELMYYDECFITNSLMGVMPVRQLGSTCFPLRIMADKVRNTYENEKMSL